MRTIRQVPFLFLGAILACPSAPAQSSKNTKMPSLSVQPDLKRARKAVELGDKAETAGRLAEALAYFEEAARYAPADSTIVGHAAALRSKLIRAHVEAAE